MEQRAHYLSPPVPGDLRSIVASAHAYDLTGYPAGIHIGLASPGVTLIVALDDGVNVTGMPRSDRRPTRFRALVGGLHHAPVRIAHDGCQRGVQVQLQVGAIRQLFDLPPAVLTMEVIHLADLWGGPDTHRLVERIAAAPGWSARATVLFDELRRRLASRTGERTLDPVLRGAWSLLVGARQPSEPTAPSVHDVAAAVGWDRRTLSARIRQEFGVPPRTVRAIARFDRAATLARRPAVSLAEAAALAGYTDQAHMTRDWTRFTGTSPGRWLAAEVLPSAHS